jgi:hypothetical protein
MDGFCIISYFLMLCYTMLNLLNEECRFAVL